MARALQLTNTQLRADLLGESRRPVRRARRVPAGRGARRARCGRADLSRGFQASRRPPPRSPMAPCSLVAWRRDHGRVSGRVPAEMSCSRGGCRASSTTQAGVLDSLHGLPTRRSRSPGLVATEILRARWLAHGDGGRRRRMPRDGGLRVDVAEGKSLPRPATPQAEPGESASKPNALLILSPRYLAGTLMLWLLFCLDA